MKNKVVVSAPGKLMLFGEHAVIYGKPCIVTAVNQRIETVIETTQGEFIKLSALDVNLKSFKAKYSTDLGKLPKGAKFVFASIKNFYKKFNVSSGLRIRTKSDFSSKFGFGSSSAVTVCVIRGLAEMFDIKLSYKQVFSLSYKTILDVQGVGSGFDLAAAIWGGTLYFVSGGKKIMPIKVDNLPLVVGYTGIKADTASLVRKVEGLYKNNQKILDGVFESIAHIVKGAKKLILTHDYQRLGTLMDFNQGYLEVLGVNTKELSSLIFAARESGAFGAKLSGAGGGDCMIAFCPDSKKRKVQDAIKKSGGIVMQIQSNAPGVKIEK